MTAFINAIAEEGTKAEPESGRNQKMVTPLCGHVTQAFLDMAERALKERDQAVARNKELRAENDRLRAALQAVAAYKPGGDHQAVLDTVRAALEQP
jgi:predicted lipid-binding transport protein (Tim44 family)